MLGAAVLVGLALVGILMAASLHKSPATPFAVASAAPADPAALPPIPDDSDTDVWIHPLAGPKRQIGAHHLRRLGRPKEGIPPEECGPGQCTIDIPTRAGDIVMAVHDGVIEEIERAPSNHQGRFIRVNHKGGSVVSSYLQLEGIREDLKPGIPVSLGEPHRQSDKETQRRET